MRIRLCILLSLLYFIINSYTAAEANRFFYQIYGEEFMIDTVSACDTLPHTAVQLLPAVAFDGTNYLAIWIDYRNNRYDIYGSRISQSGNILDPGAIPINISNQVMDFIPMTIAFDGTNYLVVWLNDSMSTIYGARIDQASVLIDTAAIVITTDTLECIDSPHVVFGDSSYFVVWNSWGVVPNVRGVRVSTSGTVIDTAWIAISDTLAYGLYPAVSFNGTDFFVVWQGFNTGIYGVRVAQNGLIIDPEPIFISEESNDCWYFSVTSDGSNILTVWTSNSGGNSDIYGVRVDRFGTVLDSACILVSTAASRQEDPRIIFNGNYFFVTWTDHRNNSSDIYGARITQSGVVLDTTGIAISALSLAQRCPVVAGNGADNIVVWEQGTNDIYCTRVDQSGAVLDSAGICVSISVDYYKQLNPCAAFDGLNYLVVWEDYRGGPMPDIYGARVDQTGAIMDVPPFPIAVEPDSQRRPSIAFDGTNYLVVWEDERNGHGQPYNNDIYGARVSPSGVVIDTQGIPISVAGGTGDWRIHPDIAFNGTDYFAVWQDLRNSGPYYNADIYGTRISTSGQVLDPYGIPVSKTTGNQEHPAVICGEDNYLITWDDTRGPGINIYCTRVDQTGHVSDTSGIAITADSSFQEFSSIAFDGTNYLVAWQDDRPANYQDDIYCARLDQSCNVLDPDGILICDAPYFQGAPAVCFDGNNYIVAWHDRRDNNQFNIFAAAVSTEGIVIDSFRVSYRPNNQLDPYITKGPGCQVFAVYEGWVDSIGGFPLNMMRTWGRLSPFPGIDENLSGIIQSAQKNLHIYPNPLYRYCNMEYTLSKPAHIYIAIYDVSGRMISEVANNKQSAGQYQKQIDMSDLAQGIYFIKMRTDDQSETVKAVLLK